MYTKVGMVVEIMKTPEKEKNLKFYSVTSTHSQNNPNILIPDFYMYTTATLDTDLNFISKVTVFAFNYI